MFSIPEWASNIYDELTEVVKIEEQRLIGTREMSRLKSGFLLREIVQRFNSKIEGSLQPNRTLWLYSAHDRTLKNMLGLIFPKSDVSIIFSYSTIEEDL